MAKKKKPDPPPSLLERERAERHQRITRALKNNKGNMRQAAIALGLSRSGLYRMCRHLQIRAGDYR
jgi:transcriptional regulator of acetoin/glycerol metabolism